MNDRLRAALGPARIALVSALAVGAALGGWQQLSAQAIAGHNSNAPVDYAADRIEMQDRNDRVVLSGNVDVTQDNLRLRAARVTVNYTDAGSLKIQRMIASGGVFVTRGGESARGDVAVYDLGQRIITMAGNVSLNRNGDTLNGGRLVINLATGRSTIDSKAAGMPGTTSKGGRVSGTFAPPKRN